ncbi:MAG: excinuclease ABC subunit UvrA [Candidatus Sumerlaeia bacterium]
MTIERHIAIRGARTNNLKNIDCDIPHNRLTVITGVSGSGKSSLAFDTLFAEGQRRFVESLSPYARQFIAQMKRPDVDVVDHIPPAIAIEQKNKVKTARSTIATATEVHDYLRLLFARLGETTDPDTGETITLMTPQRAAARLVESFAGRRGWLLAPVVLTGSARRESVVQMLLAAGFNRFWQDGEILEVAALDDVGQLKGDVLHVLIDRLKIEPAPDRRGKEGEQHGAPARLVEACARAFQMGKGTLIFRAADQPPTPAASDPDDQRTGGPPPAGAPHQPAGPSELILYEGFRSQRTGRRFRAPEPALFSFYSPLGACPVCNGFGFTLGLSRDKIVPMPWLSLNERPIAPWNTPGHREMYAYMRRTVAPDELRFDVPVKDLTPEEWDVLWNGNMDDRRRARRGAARKKAKKPAGRFCGIKGFFDWVESKKYKMHMRVFIAKYREQTLCPACHGARLKPDALLVRLRGRTIAELSRMTTAALKEFMDTLVLSPAEQQVAGHLLAELRARLDYLVAIGLGYLTLDRPTRTLSGGEAQRINLATALGSALTETLYVLDEPTIGLHPRDTDRLIGIMRRMVERGNTLVVVEHDADVIQASDHIIDLGPGAGELGGHVVYQGPTAGIAACAESLTTQYLFPAAGAQKRKKDGGKKADVQNSQPSVSRRRLCPNFRSRGRTPAGWIEVRGATENNLKNIDARFPLGVLCCVTGVSGSGKTSLVEYCLYGGWAHYHGDTSPHKGAFRELVGWQDVGRLEHVRARPIGRSIRSNPVTYIKAFDEIRRLFAATREARAAGLGPGAFSFNSRGGRCEKCEGLGFTIVDMQFLADVTVVCDACGGLRYKDPILAVRLNGKSIHDVLQMTVTEALNFFAPHKRLVRALQPLVDVGLGYLRLGQSTDTLSGGEAQRLKLAEYLTASREDLRGTGSGAHQSFQPGGRSAPAKSSLPPRPPGRRRATPAHSVLIFDEPSIGLHAADLDTLLGVFHRLVDSGYSLIVIEHNTAIIGAADWIIDLGPEGGDGGGRIVAEGPPEKIRRSRRSHTARFLSRV